LIRAERHAVSDLQKPHSLTIPQSDMYTYFKLESCLVWGVWVESLVISAGSMDGVEIKWQTHQDLV